MTRRSRIWTAVAVVYTVVNAGGAVFAAYTGEWPHAGLHVVLLLLGAGVWSAVGPARGARRSEQPEDAVGAAGPPELTDRFRNLEQSLDAIAIEVERVGEGQRLMTDLLAERGAPPPSAEGGREPIERKPERPSS